MAERWWQMLLTAFVFIVLTVPTYCQSGGLLVTAPRVWVAGGQENICIVSHASIPEVLCNIQLQKRDYRAPSFVQKNVTIASGGRICIEVPVPQDISVSTAKLSVTARSVDSSNEYNFSKSADIAIQRPAQMTFIETDKPIYKPGDLVRIRILTLTGPDLLLLTEDILLAYIEDPSKTRVMQWANVSTDNGLGSLEMQLSDEPQLGEWTIKASIKGQVPTKKFTVEEYVLPKFEVTIQHPSYLLTKASLVKWKVCARYTYGQPVGGNVSSSICCDLQYSSRIDCRWLNATKLEDGCADFAINFSCAAENFYSPAKKPKFFAEVEEYGTGVRLNSTVTANVQKSDISLKLILKADFASHHYKPGLPYYGQGQVTRPDGKSVAGQVIHVKTEPRRDGGINRGLTSFPVLNLTTDENGYFKYFLPGTFTNQDMNSIHQHISVGKSYKDIRGNYEVPRVETRTLKSWYSPSMSFLQIEPFEGIASCRSSLSLPTAFVMGNWSESPLTFYFQLTNRGDIIQAGQLTSSPVSDKEGNLLKFNITFSVTPKMSGSTKILIFTILESGETVADSMLISVEKCFHNQVSMGFTDQQKQPGHPTTLRLSADPQSMCSISVVDKSVKLMEKEDGTLSKSKVFEILKQYDISDDHRYGSRYYYSGDDCVKITKAGKTANSFGYRRRHYGWAESKYVDSKNAFADAGMIVLSDLAVVTRPCHRQPYSYSYSQYIPRPRPARRQFLPDLKNKMGSRPMVQLASVAEEDSDRDEDMHITLNSMESVEESVEDKPPTLHRTFFPESWLWRLVFVGDSGTDDINLDLPHTITEWIGNGFCANANSGLGVASPFSINAFQPFFLSFTLPYSMIRGERVGIPVSVFNYMNQCLKVMLHVNKSTAFELNRDSTVRELRVCGHQTETHTYYIVPRELGNINFTVKASSTAADDLDANSIELREIMTAEDIVTRKLLVEAEGKEEEQTKSAYICANAEGSFSIGLPDGLVEGSVRSFTSVIGDVMGPTLTGLEALLALPTGCGEQNMLKFSPNIFVMQYLQQTNSLTESIRAKATGFLQTGYQRELTYRHKDGSYSAFGESDRTGSIWLTAFVVKSFAEARPFIYIDQEDLKKSIKWITSVQLANGCFPQVGQVLHKEMKGGLGGNEENFAALTAYILIALLEAGLQPQDPVILQGVQCLERQQVSVSDTYTRSLMAYAYTMWNRNETRRAEIMDSLASMAIEADGMKHWNMANVSSSSPAATEMTSYVLLAMLHDAKEEVVSEATPIVRWLSTQRNSQGGFSSTQDTVLALQALAEFAALTHRDDLDVRVMLTGSAWNHNVSVTDHNRLLLQKQEGQNLPSTLKYSVSGSGCVLLQASVKYNIINNQEQENAFLLDVGIDQKTKSNDCKERSLKICTRYNGVDNASNMAVIAVKMVSGWIPDKDSIKKLSQYTGLRLKRFEIEKSIVHFYFEVLDKTQRCFSFRLHQDIVVTNTKPALVQVYDYYKPSLSAYDKYSITTTCATQNQVMEGNKEMRLSDQRPSQMNATKKPSETGCPSCMWNNLTELKRKFCSTPHAYEAVVINQTSLNVLKAMHSNVEINRTVSYHLANKCVSKCAVLKQGMQVVLMLPTPLNNDKKPASLKINTNVAIAEMSKIGLIAAAQNVTICS